MGAVKLPKIKRKEKPPRDLDRVLEETVRTGDAAVAVERVREEEKEEGEGK